MHHPNLNRRRDAVLLVGLLAVALAACGGPTQGYHPGQTDFTSVSPNGGARDAGGAAGGTANGGTGGPTTSPSAGGGAPARTVEEGDVYRVEGNLLYVLNQYRGFQVIDLSDPDQPKRIGMAPIYGHPVEMYIHGTRAYVVVSNYYDYWYATGGGGALGPVSSFRGSQIRVVDLSNPAAPVIIGHFDIPGEITDTRIVGDVLYTVSNRYAWYNGAQTTDNTEGTFITSIDVANPQDIHQVDQLAFPRNGYDNHVFVDQNAIYVASTDWSYDNTTGQGTYDTRVQYVDISDPAGQISLGGQIQEPGMVRDRWMLDATGGVFRMVTAPDWSGRYAPEVYTFQMGPGGTFAPLGHTILSLPHPESLTAVRFDGPRAYVVTSERIDPLFVVDLSDPANPVQRGSVSMPGWIDHIVPRGDHLVAFGHDNSNGSWQLAVSLFDVTDMDHPALLDRKIFGGTWGWVPEKADNYDKVFRVLDSMKLILVPFQSETQDQTTGLWHDLGGVQLISFDQTSLTLRGLIDARGWVRRALPYQNRILTISNQRMQTVDATDLDHPVVTGSVELARNVDDIVHMGQYAVELIGDWYSGNTRLIVLPMSQPDLGKPLAEIQVTAPNGQLFVNGHFAYLTDRNWKDGKTEVKVIDLSDPTHPRITGTVKLPDAVQWWTGYGYGWGWYGGDEVQQVGGDKLVFHLFHYPMMAGGASGGASGGPTSPGSGGTSTDPADKLFVVDLSDPASPHLASTLTLEGDDWAYGLHSVGNLLYFSHYESVGQDANGVWHVRYYLDRVDLTNPAAPRRLPKVNVPGYVVRLSDDGQTLYTLDYYWGSDNQSHEAFNALTLTGGKAVLRDRMDLQGWIGDVRLDGKTAFFTTNRSWSDAKGTWHSETRLDSMDVSDPSNLRLIGRTVLPETYGWLRAVQGHRAFVDLGYLGGMLIYDVSNPTNLKLDAFKRHQGWVSAIHTVGNTAYLACGYYGVETVDLGARQ